MKEVTDKGEFHENEKLLLCKRQGQENEKIIHRLGKNIYKRHPIKACHLNTQRRLKTQ